MFDSKTGPICYLTSIHSLDSRVHHALTYSYIHVGERKKKNLRMMYYVCV